jgi:hypothetical protein
MSSNVVEKYIHFDHLDKPVATVQSNLAREAVCDNAMFYSIIAHLHL